MRHAKGAHQAVVLSIVILLTATSVSGASVMGEAHRRGVSLYQQRKYVEAIGSLEEAIKSEQPGTAEYTESALFIGQSYYILHEAPKSIPWLEKVAGVNEASYMLGYAYLEIAQQDRSQAAFARLFHLKADSAAAHLLAGQMMLKQEYENAAVVEVTRALALNPKLPQAHFLLGEIAMFHGRFSEAIDHLGKELDLDPNFSMAWYRLGDAYTRQEHFDLAIPNLQRAVWLNPDFSGPYILLGKCYFRQRNYVNAEGILRNGLKLDPQNRQGIYLLGQTVAAAGRTEESKQIIKQLSSVPNK